MDDDNIIQDSVSDLQTTMTNFLKASADTVRDTNAVLKDSLKGLDAGVKRVIREGARDTLKLSETIGKELTKPQPDYAKLAGTILSSVENLEALSKAFPGLGDAFKPFLDVAKGFSENIDKSDNSTQNLTSSFLDVLGTSDKFGNVMKGVAGNFNNLAKRGIYAVLLDSLFKVNQQVTEIARGFGLSSGQALSLRSEISKAAFASGDLFITSTKLLASFSALSEQLGFQVNISGQLLETFTNLEQRFGFSAVEAGNLTSLLGLQSRNSEEVLNNTIKNINASRDSNLLINNTRQILKDVAGVSMATVASLGRSPQILAQAAVKARELGLTLGQVEDIADSLLNFETSISNELDAELITGKQLNLERARFLALNNDIIGLQEEIAAQGIDFAEFTNMSRIGQNALAKSLGMSRDSLTEMVFNQEKLTLAQKAGRGELAGQSLEQFKAMSAQEKLNAAIEKMQDLFSTTVMVLSPVIDILAILADIVGVILQPLGVLTSALSGKIGTFMEGVTAGVVADIQDLSTVAVSSLGGKTGAMMGGVTASTSPNIQSLSTAMMGGVTAGTSPNIQSLSTAMMGGVTAGTSPNIQGLSTVAVSSEQNNREMVAEIKALRQEMKENNRTPVVIENRIDGDMLLRNNVRGDRRGNPNQTTPSVYTDGLI